MKKILLFILLACLSTGISYGSFSFDESLKNIKDAKQDIGTAAWGTNTYNKALNTLKTETTNMKNNTDTNFKAKEYYNQNRTWIDSINNNTPYMQQAISRLTTSVMLPPPPDEKTNNNSFKINFNTNNAQIQYANAQFAAIQNDLNIKINSIKNSYLLNSNQYVYTNSYPSISTNTYSYPSTSTKNYKIMSDEEFFQQWKQQNKEDLAPVYKTRNDAKKLAEKYCIDITTVEGVYETKDCRDNNICVNHCKEESVSNNNDNVDTNSKNFKFENETSTDKDWILNSLCINTPSTATDKYNCLYNDECIDRCSNSKTKDEIIPSKYLSEQLVLDIYRLKLNDKKNLEDTNYKTEINQTNSGSDVNSESDVEELRPGIGIYTIFNGKNVIIDQIDEGSPADKAGLQKDDIIIELDGHSLENLGDISEDEYYKLMSKFLGDEGSTLNVKVKRGNQYLINNIERGMVNMNFDEQVTYNDEDFVAMINYYIDNKCSTENSIYSEELDEAFKFACENSYITDFTIDEAKLLEPVTRMDAAFILSKYAIDILGKKPDETKSCDFVDVPNIGGTLSWIKTACQLGIMGVGINEFNLFGTLSRAEFGTILSRMLWGDTYNQGGDDWYSGHLNALKNNGIMNNIDPNMKELKGWVLLMLMRNSKQ